MHIGLEKTEKINLARVKPARDRDRLGCFIPHRFGFGLLVSGTRFGLVQDSTGLYHHWTFLSKMLISGVRVLVLSLIFLVHFFLFIVLFCSSLTLYYTYSKLLRNVHLYSICNYVGVDLIHVLGLRLCRAYLKTMMWFLPWIYLRCSQK